MKRNLVILPTPQASENALTFQEHLRAEWNSEIDATMATMHPELAYQSIPALGVDVRGFDAVREYYLARMDNFPGPAFRMNDVVVTDDFAAIEGFWSVHKQDMIEAGSGAWFAGRETIDIEVPGALWIPFKDSKIVGEILYLDSREVERQLDGNGVGS